MRIRKEYTSYVSNKKKRNINDSKIENEIAKIFIEFKTQVDFLYPPLWGFKKKRSAIAIYSSSSHQLLPSKPKETVAAAIASPLTLLSLQFSSDDHESDDPTIYTNKELKNAESNLDRMKKYSSNLRERKEKKVSLMENQKAAVAATRSGSYNVGPTGIPDLNIIPPEYNNEGLDVNVVIANKRAMAAQARKNRLLICRNKNLFPINKNHRCSFTT